MTEKKEFKTNDKVIENQFEFTLYLNEHIIVKRNFPILGYNPKAINSMNFKEANDINVDLIKNHLKNVASDYMVENVNQYENNPKFDNNNNKDVIKYSVKYKNLEIAYREIDATIYPNKIRHSVNIREHIFNIITRIQRTLSEKSSNLELSYLDFQLTK